MTRRILCVDDDARILQAFERQFRDQFDIHTAPGGLAALRVLASEGPFAVVLSDLRMPDMDGIEFLTRVRQTSPDTVRIMLTGNADLSASISAVNEGKVFQFLTKPCPFDMLSRTFEAALEQHRLLRAERELLEKTLHGSIEAMSEILSLVNPAAFGRAQRIRRYVHHMTDKLKLNDSWQYELAALLSQVGCVAIPPEILEKSHAGMPLDPSEQDIFLSQDRIAHNVLAKIPRLELVAEMVARQRTSWADHKSLSEPVRTGAQLLRIALDLDDQVIRGNSLESIVWRMHGCLDYNPAFVAALRELEVEEARRETQLLTLSQLRPHMMVNSPIYSKSGLLLLAKGHEVTESAIARLESFASLFGIVEPISVTLPHIGQPEELGHAEAA